MEIQNENSFKNALVTGINIFVGSGFSVYAYDQNGKKLPTGRELLGELNLKFNRHSDDLSRLCTILESKCASELKKFFMERFTVSRFDGVYNNLNQIKIKSIYTTNIDDLIPKIIEGNKKCYINDQRNHGESDSCTAINYLPVHGNVDDESKDLVFSVSALNNVFSDSSRYFHYLSHSIEKSPTLFIGYSMNDSSVIQALTSKQTFEETQKEKWIVCKRLRDSILPTKKKGLMMITSPLILSPHIG